MRNSGLSIALGLALALSASVAAAAKDAHCFGKETCRNKTVALHLKLGAIAFILVASGLGVCLPIVGRWFTALKPENDIFSVIKAFAAGVILATGFVHVLPDAFESLTDKCLNDNPWGTFPFAGFIAMVAALCTLIIESLATSYYERHYFPRRSHSASVAVGRSLESDNDEARADANGWHARDGLMNATDQEFSASSQLLRHRIVSQVLELGILAHSAIIGVSLGASKSPCTVRPLIAALTFHQFFEGMGLGGCIVQAELKNISTALMGIFFCITMPLGIAVGIGISSIYNENSATALIVEGVFDSASAGILIYMSLVDLLAADFLNSRMQTKTILLQVLCCGSLLLAAGAVSLMAKWA